MPKKYTVTQELANAYPTWARTRTDQTSVGYRYLNSFGKSLDYMDKNLAKQGKNIYLTTANLDEIGLIHKVLLPRDFEFELDTDDPLEICEIPPTASGLHNGEWHTITLAPDNKVSEFWYKSVPNRFSLIEAVSGLDDQIVSMVSEDGTASGLWKHHLADTEHDGGTLWVETTGGTQYIKINDQKQVERARVRLRGKTRKGTFEDEMLVFAWDSKQPTQKEWEYITQVDIFEMEDGIQIDIRSSDMTSGPYMDFYNTEFSDGRKKIDGFWDLEFDTGVPVLSKIGYITDEWQQLMLGFSNKETKNSWELLDGTMTTVSGVDVALQPFTERAWVVTEDAMLYCYDLVDDMPSGLDRLVGSTPGAHVAIEVENDNVILGEPIEFLPWHARPTQELKTYKVWYQTPSGTVVTLNDVVLEEGTPLTRSIDVYTSITTTERGAYLLVLEATLADDTVQTYKTIVNVNYKQPLGEYDLSGLIPGLIDGIEFDADQNMWLRTVADDYYQVVPHTDLMLIDYSKKIVYFHEPYEEVDLGED